MRTFYYNTGVKPWNNGKLYDGDKFINNELHIPFDCDNVPENAEFMYLCGNPSLFNTNGHIIVREVLNTRMSSKYAYFRL
jgi:hypothetical protein